MDCNKSILQGCVCVYLVLVWILHKHTLFHAVGHYCIATQGCYMGSDHCKHLCYEWMEKATDATLLEKTDTHVICTDMSTLCVRWAYACVARPCSLTSRNDVVSLIKNMLMIPRYLMMRVPGRKESGVIFTTVTELPPNGRLDRSERERPSGSGLERSKDETACSERERRQRSERGKTWEVNSRRGTRKKKTQGNGDTRKHSKIVETDKNFKAEGNLNVETAILLAFAQQELHVCTLIVCEQVSCLCV